MKALVNRSGASAAVGLDDVVEPEPASDEVILDVHAASINRGELRLLGSRSEGWRPGQDVAGVVRKAARDGSGPPEGTRVVALVEQGGWAERVVASAGKIAELATDITFQEAACLPIAGLTALRSLRVGGDLLGRRVLVCGASGGVGRFAVELGNSGGAAVTAVARAGYRSEGLRELGAEEVVGTVGELTEPYDIILESVGGDTLAGALRLGSQGARVVILGNSSGERAQFGARDFGAPFMRVVRFRVFNSPEPPTFKADLERLVWLTSKQRLHPQVGLAVRWEEANRALGALEAREVNGKVVLEVE